METITTRSRDTTSPVIFRLLAENLTTPISQKFYERCQLTDHGDHVEWTNGKQVWKWRLPDQADGPAAYPVVAAILLVGSKSMLGLGNGSDRVAFLDTAGNILAHVSPQPLIPVEIRQQILPDEAYAELQWRGVKLVREEYTSIKELYTAHPDPSLNRFSLSFASHPGLWMFGVILAIIIIVNIILLLSGYYA